jgi:hypothetical protein
MEAQMLLRNADTFPSDKVLKDALGDVYIVLESFLGTITNEEYHLNIDWRYYNDGKAWLGKVQHKKKTVLWLSVWEDFFKVSFFFTEKHFSGERGIRTPGTSQFNGFQDRRDRPLCHLSNFSIALLFKSSAKVGLFLNLQTDWDNNF